MKLLIQPSDAANAANRPMAQAPAPGLRLRATLATRTTLLGLAFLGSVFFVEPALAELPTAVAADGAAMGIDPDRPHGPGALQRPHLEP